MPSGNVDDLLARLHATVASGEPSRPIAILTGSGLTAGAIPGVTEIVNIVRHRVSSDDQIELDRRLAAIDESSLKYQEAFTFLSLRHPPELRDRIITLCTLRAYHGQLPEKGALLPSRLTEYEADTDNWHLPHGVAALGRIWAGLPANLRGPILTTNFDPLCEIAIQKAGGHVVLRIMDSDGSFLRDVRTVSLPQVVHLHGYWRESATLSMTTQLTLERPALEGSIRALLGQYTLVVIGYGAWRDALARQLVHVIREQEQRELDILWCYYGGERELDEEYKTNEVLSALLQAPGNVQFYTDVDANKVLPALERKISDRLVYSDAPRGRPGQGTLIDWMPVAEAVTRPASASDNSNAALTFFDGRLPNWQDAVNPLLPKRDVVRTLENQLKESIRRGQSSLTLVTGASGEGKTTVLMQTAASATLKSQPVIVLFNGQGRSGAVDDILSLPTSAEYILVLDDAYNSIERLRDLVVRLNQSGRKGLHLLLGSRDSDWGSVGGFTFAWSKYLPTKVYRLRGINRPDASAVVQSWERLGPEALGSLALLPDTEARISALMTAAADERDPLEGAFLGALLKTRYGAGLVEHIHELLIRLSQRRIYSWSSEPDSSLLDAFFLVAAPHAARVKAMTASVLAISLDISEQEVFGAVVLPLGDEAAISTNSETILVRHSLIARSACNLAPELGVDLGRIVERVVRAAVVAIDRYGPKPELRDLAYLARHLEDPALAVRAATAAVDAAPRRLSYRTSLSRAYRMADDPNAAVRVVEEALAGLWNFDDLISGARPLFTEWGVAEGNLGHWARNAVLVGISLQDMDAWSRPYVDQQMTALGCLALAMKKLWELSGDRVFVKGLAGMAEVASGWPLDAEGRKRFQETEDIVTRCGESVPSSLESACRAIADACRAAWGRVECPFPEGLPPRRFRFDSILSLAHESTYHRTAGSGPDR
jgi:SIR2-like domain